MAGETWLGGNIIGERPNRGTTGGGYIPAAEIPNAPKTVDMPMIGNYPSMFTQKFEYAQGAPDMSKRAADLMQKELPSSFEEAGNIRAQAAGQGQMAIGKAIASGGETFGKAIGVIGEVMSRIRAKTLESNDQVGEIKARNNQQLISESFQADSIKNNWTPTQQLEYWPKYADKLKELNGLLPASPSVKEKIEISDNAFVTSRGYKVQNDANLKILNDNQDLLNSEIKTGVEKKDPDSLYQARIANDKALELGFINDAKHAENADLLTNAQNQFVETAALNGDPWQMEKETAKVMNGGTSDSFPHLKNQPERARSLNSAARESINRIEAEGAQAYQDRMDRGEIKFEDRDKAASELHVRPTAAKSINKDADSPDPVYDPRIATRLDTRIQSYNPAIMGDELRTRKEFYAIKEEIRSLPRAHRQDYEERLADRLNGAINGQTVKANVADQLLAGTFKHLDALDTGEEGSLFGDDGTNHERGEKQKVRPGSEALYSEHFSQIETIKDGMRRFIKENPDASPGQVYDEYRKQVKPFLKGPGGVEAFTKATSTLPTPKVTAEMIAAERKRIEEKQPPTAVPYVPRSGYPTSGPQPGSSGGSGYPATAPEGAAAPGSVKPHILSKREEIMSELDRNPATARLMYQMMDTEGGGAATVESLVNRVAMIRQKVPGWTIWDELNSGFYGPIKRGYAQTLNLHSGTIAKYQHEINIVRAGSNILRGRTDQGYKGDPNWQGPGRVHVSSNPKEIYNYWVGSRRGAQFSHADSARFASEYG